MKVEFLLAVLLYAGLLLGAGLLFPKKFGGLEAFFLASRRLGAPRIAFSLCAGWVGAASLLVSTDQAFREGISAYWIIGLPAVATLLLFLPLARVIRNLAGSTISDAMEARYGSAARAMTTVLIVWYMMVLAASQMVAAGKFLETFLGTPYLVSLSVAVAVVMIYLGAGGFLSVIRTQTVQFFLLVAGILALTISLGLRSGWSDVKTLARAQAGPGYLMHRQETQRGGDHLFVSEEGQPLVYWKVHSVFRSLLKSAGIQPSGGRWPRIHELRHTLAVRALESSPTGRQRIGQHMLALATYLGHVNINATYWYLETTPELLRDIAVVTENFVQGGRP